jgi:hypothetical protein
LRPILLKKRGPMLEFSPSVIFEDFVEGTPLVDSKAWVQLYKEIDRLKRERKPEGRFQYTIKKGDGIPELVFDFYLSGSLKQVFGLAGYLKRKGEPTEDVRRQVEKAVKFIVLGEANKRRKHDEHGGKS